MNISIRAVNINYLNINIENHTSYYHISSWYLLLTKHNIHRLHIIYEHFRIKSVDKKLVDTGFIINVQIVDPNLYISRYIRHFYY